MRLLLDTNVLLDYYVARPGFSPDARKLFAYAALGKVELWASAKSFTDVFYLGRKKLASEPLQQLIERSLSVLRVCSLDGTDVMTCLAKRWSDFEDCVVAWSAEKVKADFLVSRDANGFAASKVPVKTPTEALFLLEADLGLEIRDPLLQG